MKNVIDKILYHILIGYLSYKNLYKVIQWLSFWFKDSRSITEVIVYKNVMY